MISVGVFLLTMAGSFGAGLFASSIFNANWGKLGIVTMILSLTGIGTMWWVY